MLCMEIVAVCSEIHTKHINILCGQNVELLNVKLVVHKVSRRLSMVNRILLYTAHYDRMSSCSLSKSREESTDN